MAVAIIMDDKALDSRNLSTLRQLRWLVLLLILSNVGLGCFGFYVLRQVDRKYSALIGQAIPSLNELQILTATSMEAMRGTNTSLWPARADRAEMVNKARHGIRRDRELRQHALDREWLASRAELHRNLEEAGETFTGDAEVVVSLLEKNDDAAAAKARAERLRPSFDGYVAVTTRVADVLQNESLRSSSSLTARTGNISEMMLGIAGWPLLLLGAFLLFVAVFVVSIFLKTTFSQQESL